MNLAIKPNWFYTYEENIYIKSIYERNIRIINQAVIVLVSRELSLFV